MEKMVCYSCGEKSVINNIQIEGEGFICLHCGTYFQVCKESFKPINILEED